MTAPYWTDGEVTPTEEARRALHGGTSRDGLRPVVRAEYDRLLALVLADNPQIASSGGDGLTEKGEP